MPRVATTRVCATFGTADRPFLMAPIIEVAQRISNEDDRCGMKWCVIRTESRTPQIPNTPFDRF
jgi:hypothetical protein